MPMVAKLLINNGDIFAAKDSDLTFTAVCAWDNATDGMLYEPGLKRGF